MRTSIRRAFALSTAAVAVMALSTSTAQAADPPTLRDGHGLTQLGAATGNATDFVITVTTPEVTGEHHIRIILPTGYHDDPARRYPVMYWLHGANSDPVEQNYAAMSDSDSMITVMPDGGARSWYANWLNQKTALGAQNWENFHIRQVVPFVDANLRTVATRQARAVVGLSMGGFGAFHYAQKHPHLFGQAASLSGDIDLSTKFMALRMAVVASLVVYKPAVDSDAVFGSPYPVFGADRRWNEVDPSQHVDRFAGVGVYIYVGNAGGRTTDPEFWLEGAAQNVAANMRAQGLPHHFVDFGDGSNWGTGCDGGHNTMACRETSLRDLIPRLAKAFAG
ncbi:alpha/beta hydrolase [Kibdelosporangium phytohabitans]|uniref:Esterase n=1 Tax=Kibdelosporangium phytohabitans TaxID=860235 RepID=A0A0N9I2H4_9PSEU|nr:alpha/beta hydrolase-fold protein [Kibdelosporangium phytohabitans]ALG08402.1 esterase [Kibdelosporangium phytohabitans]MBE1470549.1 S-formylglutathione hydrolase FrmB [Kibdelosporangium phytohabitans]